MTDQANTTVSELLDEIDRLRPHYQSGTATDAGRRQMLDHFAEFAGKLSARRAADPPYSRPQENGSADGGRATADVTEAKVERGAVALFQYDYPKDKWSRFGQKDYHPERYRAKSRAALLAAQQAPE